MRQFTTGLLSLVLALAGLSGLAGPAGATDTRPQLISRTLSPSTVIFRSGADIKVTITFQIDEPDGWQPTGTASYDLDRTCPGQEPDPGPSCNIPIDTEYSSVTDNVRTLRVAWVEKNANGRRYPGSHVGGVDVPYRHADGTTASVEGFLPLVVSGARLALDAPDTIRRGSSLTLDATAEQFGLDWHALVAPLTLQFKADGSSTWETRGSQRTDDTGRVTFREPAVDDSGTWRVSVENPFEGTVYSPEIRVGLVDAAVTPPSTPVAAAPSVPRSVATTAAHRAVRLSWSPPVTSVGSAVPGYQVRVGKTVRNLGASARSHLFTRLKNNRRYAFDVRARNTVGYSAWARAYGTPRKPPRARSFANCTQMHTVFPHGVGRPGAVDNGGVTNFHVSRAIYDKNTKSDRDRDGIACEA